MTTVGIQPPTHSPQDLSSLGAPTTLPTSEASPQALQEHVDQLREALASRTVIGEATGIISGRLQISTETSWRILRRTSMDTNNKIRRVAEVVVSSHDGNRPSEDDPLATDIAPLIGFQLDRQAEGAVCEERIGTTATTT